MDRKISEGEASYLLAEFGNQCSQIKTSDKQTENHIQKKKQVFLRKFRSLKIAMAVPLTSVVKHLTGAVQKIG